MHYQPSHLAGMHTFLSSVFAFLDFTFFRTWDIFFSVFRKCLAHFDVYKCLWERVKILLLQVILHCS